MKRLYPPSIGIIPPHDDNGSISPSFTVDRVLIIFPMLSFSKHFQIFRSLPRSLPADSSS